MAARRDRERRRPSPETRYRFASPESVAEPDKTVADSEPTRAVEAPADRNTRSRRATTSALPDSRVTIAPTHAGARPAHPPFSAYAAEYAYVLTDLRRVALVIGSLLVILILLNFVLPH